MKLLGLDVGQRSIGVASGEILAEELTTLRAKKDTSFYEEPARSSAYEQLSKLVNQQGTAAFVVGLPLTEDDSLSSEAKLIKSFGQELEKKLNQRVFFVNETLTSLMAEDILESQGVSPSEAKDRVDQLSASLILQQYLEEHALA